VPDIKLDFSRVAYSNVLELLAPVVPGGILAVGTLVLNPTLAGRILSNLYLGYRSRLAAAIFISYAAGLLLNLLVSYTSFFVGFMFGYTGIYKLLPNKTPWQNLHWRKLARRFLGPDLSPITDDFYFKELHEQKLKEANAIPDAEERSRQVKLVQEFFVPKSEADAEWYWWYQILDKYFANSQSGPAPWQYFLSMVHTASWAVILLMVLNHRNHWLAWVLCITGIFFGNGTSWFFQRDPYSLEQMAMLLRALKPISLGKIEVEKE
jgi:hypothetical protein